MKIKTSCLLLTTCFLLLSCLCNLTYSQQKEKPVKKFYLQLETGFSSHNGTSVEVGIQALLKRNWTTSFSYQHIIMDPKNIPANYQPAITIVDIFLPFFYDEYPDMNMSLLNFSGGKYFETGRKTWFTTEAGISIIFGESLHFTPIEPDLFSSNYSVKRENKTTIGGTLKADFNWAFLRFMGMGAGAFANFNSIQSPIGFQVKLIFGWMNLKPKQKSKNGNLPVKPGI